MPYNLPLKVFTKIKFVADFLRGKSYFLYGKRKNVVFEAPFGGLGETYAVEAVHLRPIAKPVGDFLLVIIELFSLGAFVLSQFTRLTDGRTDRRRTDAHRKDSRCIQCSAVKKL